LVERYQRASVFCLPSSYEGFGVPYIEAMAAGCPVLATPNVGAIEVLGAGAFGRIVQPERLGPSLLELLEDPAARATLSRSGRRRATEYDWATVVDRYERIYERILR
jgi:glycosyltransferase involved in cell wall biosynthesis